MEAEFNFNPEESSALHVIFWLVPPRHFVNGEGELICTNGELFDFMVKLPLSIVFILPTPSIASIFTLASSVSKFGTAQRIDPVFKIPVPFCIAVQLVPLSIE